MYYHTVNPQIRDHEITFEPFLYQMRISGRFELVTPFEIPPQTLFVTLSFPNQTVKDLEMVPDRREHCSSDFGRCGVFRIRGFLMLSGDKYFSREIDEYESIPLRTTFELRTANWSLFRSVNRIYDAHGPKYIGFVEGLKLLELENHILYRNAFGVEREKYGAVHKSVDVPVMWRVGKGGKSEAVTSRLDLRLEDHDGVAGKPIDRFLSLGEREGLEVGSAESLLTLPDGREIRLAPPERERGGGRILLRPSEGLVRTGEGDYVADPLGRGIYIPGRAEGFLRHRILVRLGNNSFYLNVRNHYSFSGNRTPESLKIVVVRREDDHFRHLHRFGRIDI